MFRGQMGYTHLPYCLVQQLSGRYMLLNRNYKPIGFVTDEGLDYDSYPITIEIKGLTPDVAASLDCRQRALLEAIFLYDDDCIPTDDAASMEAYLKRLGVLMTLKTERYWERHPHKA
jgi:hypothetical protein